MTSFSGSSCTGNHQYYSSDTKLTPSIVKYAGTRKSCQRLFVWEAISKNIISKIEFLDQVMVNQGVYVKLPKKTLRSFIFKNHQSFQNVVFWPDKATGHYARSIADWLESENISYIPKDENPPNCPPVRPIEK